MNPVEIRAAQTRIGAHLRETPVLQVEAGAFGAGGPAAPITLKLELLQHAGSFKPRGALNRILSAQERAPLTTAGVIAASGGNHGVAVAWAAWQLGLRAEIFVPVVASAAKIGRIRNFGADIQIGGTGYAEALVASAARAAATGALVVHAYDQPETIAGQGTVAMEFEQQAPHLDTVLVACGGGGLVAGIAAWYQGRVKVVAVEPESCPTLFRARAAGAPVDVAVSGVAVDSLGARRIGDLAFGIVREFVADAVLVGDDAIRSAQQALWRELRIAAEPGGAAALAALLCGAYTPAPGERVGVLVCGGNVELKTLA